MKRKFFLCAIVLMATLSASAQLLRTEELEKYAKEKYGEKWVDAAATLGNNIQLDKNNAITYVQVVEAAGKSKEDLYILLNYWFTASFNDANSVIKLNDKESGVIIAEGCISDIADHRGGMNGYDVSINPVIKCDIKDGKIRVTYTVPYYVIIRHDGGGWIGALAGAEAVDRKEKWTLDKCYPFVEKDKHKKASSKALVMAHAYSNVVMDKIEECVKNGLVGNEGEDW